MVTITKDTQQIDDLESRSFTKLGSTASEAGPEVQNDPQQAQALAAIEAGAAAVVLALFKVARSLIARHLPEIMDEWSDVVIKEPAKAAVPLIKKHMQKIMEVLGSNPELAVFAMSLVPLGMGYVAALERHDKKPPVEVVENVKPLHAV